MESLKVNIKKKLKEFDLDVEFELKQKHLGILGPSGCGKSMTLKSIAGIVNPDEGIVSLTSDVETVYYDSARKINLKPQKRNVGYLFQNYALFPNMTVEENVAIGLSKNNKKDVSDIIKRFRLEGLEKRYPRQLSGGQQQRVAIARAIATDPDIIYFDEPTSALDPELIGEVLEVMRRLAEDGMTMLVVTHEMSFAKNVSNKVIFMEQGNIVKMSSSKDFFENPDDERIKTFNANIGR